MKVRKISMFTQLFMWLAILLLFGNGVLGVLAYKRSSNILFEQIQTNAKNIAQSAAYHVSGDILREITIGEEDTQEYAHIIEELAVFRDHTELEYIYTLRQVKEDYVEFVVDSDPEEPANIGDECEITEALLATFSEKITTADEEAFADEWGTHISAYSPIFDGDTVVGAVGVDISANWIEEQKLNLRNLVMITCIMTYLFSLVVLQFLMMKFRKSLKKLNDKVNELASGSGDLTKEIDIATGDELEVIAGNMNAFLCQVRSLVKDVANSTKTILSTGEEMNVTVSENTRIMAKMNGDIQEINSNMEESADSSKQLSEDLAESAEQMAAFAQNVNDICTMVQQANENAQATSMTAKENRNNAMRSIYELQEKMRETSKEAQKVTQVKQIAEEIGHIASQTRMLSLNAQIEAARAGSMGAGFAIVATQVGKLSNDIDSAVAQINAINNEVLSALSAMTNASEEMIRFVSEDVVKDYDAFADLGEEYGSTTGTIHTQMSEIEKQSIQISRNIADINQSVQIIASTVISTADNANALLVSTNKIAESLENLNNTSQNNSLQSEQLNKQLNNYTF